MKVFLPRGNDFFALDDKKISSLFNDPNLSSYQLKEKQNLDTYCYDLFSMAYLILGVLYTTYKSNKDVYNKTYDLCREYFRAITGYSKVFDDLRFTISYKFGLIFVYDITINYFPRMEAVNFCKEHFPKLMCITDEDWDYYDKTDLDDHNEETCIAYAKQAEWEKIFIYGYYLYFYLHIKLGSDLYNNKFPSPDSLFNLLKDCIEEHLEQVAKSLSQY